jgi:hypothetical protein
MVAKAHAVERLLRRGQDPLAVAADLIGGAGMPLKDRRQSFLQVQLDLLERSLSRT